MEKDRRFELPFHHKIKCVIDDLRTIENMYVRILVRIQIISDFPPIIIIVQDAIESCRK